MEALIIVKPETVIDWQRRRFKKYWTKKSSKRKRLGRSPLKLEIRQHIKKMATENFIWGAPRIYSEFLKLGYTKNQVSQRTISRYLKKIRPNEPDKAKGKRQVQQLKNAFPFDSAPKYLIL